MAIASFIIHTTRQDLAGVKASLSQRRDATILPWESPPCLVAVIERPSKELERVEREFKATPGVLSVATAYLNIEDELGGEGAK
ncbi:MAG: chaperone NapD [Desulfovibrio sp.]|jgi:nitrate reductase NapAB chaperone NapD|nr:chaperone NapD [Desulfovibrio sp.]